MARDRLAAMRAQRQGGYGEPVSYPAPSYDGGGDRYASRQVGRYYMSSELHLKAVDGDDMATFYAQISSIQDSLRTLNDNVSRISDLHSRSLNSMDEMTAQRNANQLDGLVAETSVLINKLKVRIKYLQKKGSLSQDGQTHIRKQHTAQVRRKFVEEIQNYQQIEQQYRMKYKQRMERQFKIVKPDASPEEVKAMVDEYQGAQIFAVALQSSNRHGESRAAFREVQARHQDIKRIERTLGELAQLFNDMATTVEQQDSAIDAIQTMGMNVEKNTEIGLRQTDKAVSSARSSRKLRWTCLILVFTILIVLAIVLTIELAEAQRN